MSLKSCRRFYNRALKRFHRLTISLARTAYRRGKEAIVTLKSGFTVIPPTFRAFKIIYKFEIRDGNVIDVDFLPKNSLKSC